MIARRVGLQFLMGRGQGLPSDVSPQPSAFAGAAVIIRAGGTPALGPRRRPPRNDKAAVGVEPRQRPSVPGSMWSVWEVRAEDRVEPRQLLRRRRAAASCGRGGTGCPDICRPAVREVRVDRQSIVAPRIRNPACPSQQRAGPRGTEVSPSIACGPRSGREIIGMNVVGTLRVP